MGLNCTGMYTVVLNLGLYTASALSIVESDE